MATSIFLRELIGPVMALVGVSVLANEAAFRKLAQEFLRSPALIFLAGMILMPAGLAIVLSHNVWVADWPVIITLLGWIAVISGAVRIFAPDRVTISGRRFSMTSSAWPPGAFWVAVGAALCYFGYSLKE